jgi:5,10-methylenetetrahydromethanopterin reductase
MGVELWSAGGNVAGQAARLARRAEGDGYDGISFGDTECSSPDPYVGLAAAAAATTTLKLAVGVTNPVTRHPSVTASAIAGVHAESGGRAVLGLGRGDSAVTKLGLRAAGVADLEQYLVRVQGYLSGEPVDVDGHESRLQWLDGVSLPKVPVDMAATGPGVIAVGARHAERVTFNVGADPSRVTQAVALAREAAAQAGRRHGPSLGAYLNIAPHPDRDTARALVRGVVATYARFSGMPGHPVNLLPPEDASVITSVAAHYDMSRHGRSDAPHAALVDEGFIDRFAVAGPAAYCIERLTALLALGLDRLMIVGPAHDGPHEVVAESRHLLAQQVLPGVHAAGA